MKKLVFMSLLMSLVFLTGCNSNKIVEIEITPKGNAMEFATKSFEVKAGQEVKLIMNFIFFLVNQHKTKLEVIMED